VAGERLYRLLPLGVPPSSVGLRAEEAQAFPAIQLFVERRPPYRAAAAQTLGTTLDWSYQCSPNPSVGFCTVSQFSLAVSRSKQSDAVISGGERVVDQVANLVTKSLITADIGGDVVYYRLLETMRAYALNKLEESGEGSEYARRHADYFRALFRRAELEWDRRPTAEWVETYVSQTDNVRPALEWAFSPSGDVTRHRPHHRHAAVWLQLSLMTNAATCGPGARGGASATRA